MFGPSRPFGVLRFATHHFFRVKVSPRDLRHRFQTLGHLSGVVSQHPYWSLAALQGRTTPFGDQLTV